MSTCLYVRVRPISPAQWYGTSADKLRLMEEYRRDVKTACSAFLREFTAPGIRIVSRLFDTVTLECADTDTVYTIKDHILVADCHEIRRG